MKISYVLILFFLLLILVNAGFYRPPSFTKVSLGKRLFNEKLLSKDYSVSCASCHKPQYAFADTVAFSVGIYGKLTSRNTPSVLNVKNRPYYFWDGRAGSLEEQALMPIANPDEMGLPIDEAVKRLNASAFYSNAFKQVFKQKPNVKNLALAFAAFENSLETIDSKFDDWANNLGKLSAAEERGRQLFIGSKAKCFDCHSMEDFTDDNFKNIGLFDGKDFRDSGRFRVTKLEKDLGSFKTPGLRNVAVTAPYMHDGRFKTLEEVVTFYNNPSAFVEDAINIDTALKKPLNLNPQEKKDLVAFLNSLTDKKYWQKISRP